MTVLLIKPFSSQDRSCADEADGQYDPEPAATRQDVGHQHLVHCLTPRRTREERGDDATHDQVQGGKPEPPRCKREDSFDPVVHWGSFLSLIGNVQGYNAPQRGGSPPISVFRPHLNARNGMTFIRN